MTISPNRDARPVAASPPTDRVVAVVEFLASRPGEPATVADLVRHLGLNRATCHAVLTSLLQAGWVLRERTSKTFTPGPALIALGRAAESGAPAARAADGELGRLAEDLGLACTISYPSGDRLVIGSRRPAPSGGPDRGSAVGVGQRFPFSPPFAPGLVAWGPEGEVDRWLARSARAEDAASVERLHTVLATVRRRGYTVVCMTRATRHMRGILADLDSLSSRQRPAVARLLQEIGAVEQLDDDLDEGRSYPVSLVAAPAFGRDGFAFLNVSVHVWQDLDPAEIRAVGGRLVAASRAITRELGGRVPGDFPGGV